MPPRVLFICGSMNQTTQMHAIASELPDHDVWFTPYYVDGVVEFLRRIGLMEITIIGKRWREGCLAYLAQNKLPLDFEGRAGGYDLVVSCTDLFVPKNVEKSPGVLVQEGMTDPETFVFHLVRRFRFLPRWLASTAATGLSNWYERFCVASEGYRDLFIQKGASRDKIVVTGIPNFDDCAKYLKNHFPLRGYVLVCTSDARETFKIHDRREVIRRAARIAAGRPIIFKLHPNERVERARREILELAPNASIHTSGSAEEMIANCDVLVTEYSSTAFVGLALGKEVHSFFPLEELKRLLPLQNQSAAKNIAGVCRDVITRAGSAQKAEVHLLPLGQPDRAAATG